MTYDRTTADQHNWSLPLSFVFAIVRYSESENLHIVFGTIVENWRKIVTDLSAEVESTNSPQDGEFDVGTLLFYLESDKGHKLASRALAIIEDIKKATLEKNSSHAVFKKCCKRQSFC